MMKRLLSLLMLLLLACTLALAEEAVPAPNGEVLPMPEATGTDTQGMDPAFLVSAPFVPDGTDRAVLGSDDRITIRDTESFPYMPIANMYMQYNCGCSGQGTGFMVGDKWMLTAGHCLRCVKHDLAWAQTIDFYFGWHNNSNYAYRYEGRWTAWAYYSDNISYDPDDFGIIRFENADVGNYTGWLGIQVMTHDTMNGNYYYVAGYREGLLKRDYGRASTTHKNYRSMRGTNKIYFYGDSVPGNSGCPVFTSEGYAVAIHIEGNAQAGFNLERIIDDDVFQTLIDVGFTW